MKLPRRRIEKLGLIAVSVAAFVVVTLSVLIRLSEREL